ADANLPARYRRDLRGTRGYHIMRLDQAPQRQYASPLCGRGRIASIDAMRVRGWLHGRTSLISRSRRMRIEPPHPARTLFAPPSPTRGEGSRDTVRPKRIAL